MFQDYGKALLPWRNAAQNVSLALEAIGMPRPARQRRIEELLAKVGLAGDADKLPRELSGGMQQRLQIARCLAQEPSVLLMDEPFGSLDAMTRQTLQDETLAIAAASDASIVFVTHDLDEAIYLGDRVVGLSGSPGRIRETVAVHLPRPRDSSRRGKTRNSRGCGGRCTTSSARSSATVANGEGGSGTARLRLARTCLAIALPGRDGNPRHDRLRSNGMPLPRRALSSRRHCARSTAAQPSRATRDTLVTAGSGLLLGLVIGLLLAIPLGLFRSADYLMKVPIEAIRPVPMVALIPLSLLIFGFGYRMEIAVVTLAALWPIFLMTRSAIGAIEPQLLEVSQALGLGLFARVTKVVLPAVLPRIFVAFRIALGIALVVAVTVEITANPLGLGYAITVAQQSLQPDLMFALLLWIGLLGWSLNALLLRVEAQLFGRAA